jgi:DNA-binding NtrC family response regulator
MRTHKIPPAVAAPTIYVVDDAPFLTELYINLLRPSGYMVRAFKDRVEALAALNADPSKPDLLITDYRGPSMPVEQFMHRCRTAHPALRILMISGFRRTDVRFSQTRPDRYIEKPFRIDQFRKEVSASLA